MDHKLLQIPFNQDILLIIYTEKGQRKPAFVLRNGFQPESFEPPQVQKPAQLSSINLSLDTDTWKDFQSICAELEITPEDCFNAWVLFSTEPESQETAIEFLKREAKLYQPHYFSV